MTPPSSATRPATQRRGGHPFLGLAAMIGGLILVFLWASDTFLIFGPFKGVQVGLTPGAIINSPTKGLLGSPPGLVSLGAHQQYGLFSLGGCAGGDGVGTTPVLAQAYGPATFDIRMLPYTKWTKFSDDALWSTPVEIVEQATFEAPVSGVYQFATPMHECEIGVISSTDLDLLTLYRVLYYIGMVGLIGGSLYFIWSRFNPRVEMDTYGRPLPTRREAKRASAS